MKAVLITGASRGIGRATALLTGAHGWPVGANYRTERAAAEEVVGVIEAAGGRAVALAGDVAAEADVVALFAGAEAALGRRRGSSSTQGSSRPRYPGGGDERQRLRRIFEVNTLGAYLCAPEAARRLSRGRGAFLHRLNLTSEEWPPWRRRAPRRGGGSRRS